MTLMSLEMRLWVSVVDVPFGGLGKGEPPGEKWPASVILFVQGRLCWSGGLGWLPLCEESWAESVRLPRSGELGSCKTAQLYASGPRM